MGAGIVPTQMMETMMIVKGNGRKCDGARVSCITSTSGSEFPSTSASTTPSGNATSFSSSANRRCVG